MRFHSRHEIRRKIKTEFAGKPERLVATESSRGAGRARGNAPKPTPAGSLMHFLTDRHRGKNQRHDAWQCKENHIHGVNV
jgi:hypothetical protein